MIQAYSKIIQSLPGDKPQCYVTANKVFDAMLAADIPKCKKRVVDGKLEDFLEIKGNSVSVVEIHVVIDPHTKIDPAKLRSKYGIVNSFWIPRLFAHAFNVIVAGEYVDVWQSWDKTSDYAHIWRIPRDDFADWIQRLQTAIKNYCSDPKDLFDIFEHDKLIKHVRGLPPISLLFDMIKGERPKCVSKIIVKTVFVGSQLH
jgi:hypothetical protein